MILLSGRAATYGELWFDEAPPADAGVDIFQYRFRGVPVSNGRATPLLTMVTDLVPEEEAILARFGKDCRYKIRRADTKDGLAFEFSAEPEQRLEGFADFFDAFAKQKGHSPCDRHWLRAACEAGQLALSAAYRDAEALVWHAHVLCAGTAGLQYTASHFRGQDNDFRALVGRANRWLHWQDMQKFKSMGFSRYDWGGLFADESTPERAGINRFKRDFGGEQVRLYECRVPVSARGRVYLPLRDAWRRLAA
ncbi:MAG TPA: GNAT family N-acetyltransferase [Burkholderiales bacterium]|nr:GNAT family N-acetyltransferase [Burkholderiales bacterium]